MPDLYIFLNFDKINIDYYKPNKQCHYLIMRRGLNKKKTCYFSTF
ncbi:conserved hypothetical protein [Xenorhabdus nematophila F1]|uniref:Uncharacterized protein n=1 Tax=Xenorhabdus nematophila (strain ATCC 19061 / DSM 3370 / CCUG 14189 / LMG 1036 / NCIMB 9965 / AN6) TaxID=406817 RepID=D3VCN4_XENNA|nr:hypothetical protein XNC1_4044 [Xenorhabdus nematophila ATCC 19061]CCW31561.1 conserved hypothetical protein [Xenorhabdus nematophila F1]CEE90788.1 hypothetical protein XNA1_1710035 [Xenorhabdus nematophila str. Anatoliense]CEF28952.1 hypothetical protein XNW1_1450034 [Xenorhabdus nematophila str. Websteri]CEK24884.1 hypothetical protein XNC2_3897 [Xenorhabdus nematophila AN6/1]